MSAITNTNGNMTSTLADMRHQLRHTSIIGGEMDLIGDKHEVINYITDLHAMVHHVATRTHEYQSTRTPCQALCHPH